VILNKGLISGMAIVGERFKKCEIYVPEVLIAARAMHAAMDVLKPVLSESGVEPLAKVAIGTTKGDLHDIGKNLVAMMHEGTGLEVIDLGVDVGPDKFVETIKQNDVKLIGISALLTTTMLSMKAVIEKVAEEGLRDKVKIIIGGAPVTQGFADEIGADGYAPDASSAVDLTKQLLSLN
jgi:5-methyltetrahydrofolate--homocysteine methyltransferase